MKKVTFLLSVFLTSIIFSCSNENIESVEKPQIVKKKQETEVVVTENDGNHSEDFMEHCKSLNLIAGQHYVAGTVTVDVVGENLIITYTTNAEWTLGVTHLSLNDCSEGSFPTTNSGNPKVGNFEYSSTHANGTTQVIYSINLEDVTEQFCFAAHAEVSGPSQETAWGEGLDFGGNSWAMYVEANLTDCNDDDGDNNGGGGGIG